MITATSLKGQKFIDFSYDSQQSVTGDLIVLRDREAIQNALVLWLYSLRGEKIRLPSQGGYVTKWLFKPLTLDTQQNIQFAIASGLQNEFSPILKIKEINVTPDNENDSWLIEVKAVITRTQEEIYAFENIRRIV